MIPSTNKCLESLVLSMFPGEIGGLTLYLGFWGNSTLPTGANPVVPQQEEPPRGNSRVFFFCVLGRDEKSNERHRKQ